MLGYDDNRMDAVPVLDVVQSIEQTLDTSQFSPDVIMTHSPWCLNVDHRVVFEAAQVAFRGRDSRFMCFEIPSSSEWNLTSQFRANTFIKISPEDASFKLRALAEVYGDEMRLWPHPRSLEMIKRRMAVDGSICCLTQAEKFMTLREVMT